MRAPFLGLGQSELLFDMITARNRIITAETMNHEAIGRVCIQLNG
jgi:hypothetical protein